MNCRKLNTWGKILVGVIIVQFALSCYSLYIGKCSQALYGVSTTLLPIIVIFGSISKKNK